MNSKPRSQIGRIGHVPVRARNAAPVAPTSDNKETARQGTSGIARPSSSRLQSFQGDSENRPSLLWSPARPA
ncbi:hypothetical protein J4E91_000520 [Alternaria rosae]|nr:hypothetical protein J4E91_000520 [Alternaria rosae]